MLPLPLRRKRYGNYVLETENQFSKLVTNFRKPYEIEMPTMDSNNKFIIKFRYRAPCLSFEDSFFPTPKFLFFADFAGFCRNLAHILTKFIFEHHDFVFMIENSYLA